MLWLRAHLHLHHDDGSEEFHNHLWNCLVPRMLTKIPDNVFTPNRKKERTTALVVAAIQAGFRAIDTACQLKHYRFVELQLLERSD